tara:strand:+ start:8733 stop:8930 length:198 start_codon:yes stop_codon:yes gene_type:complete
MSKTKQWAWDTAEKESDNIIKSYVDGDITKDNAINKLSNVNNIEMCGIDEHNVDEVLEMAKAEVA